MLTFELSIKSKYFNSVAMSSFESVKVGPGILSVNIFS